MEHTVGEGRIRFFNQAVCVLLASSGNIVNSMGEAREWISHVSVLEHKRPCSIMQRDDLQISFI